jgi:hypothetical protein
VKDELRVDRVSGEMSLLSENLPPAFHAGFDRLPPRSILLARPMGNEGAQTDLTGQLGMRAGREGGDLLMAHLRELDAVSQFVKGT